MAVTPFSSHHLIPQYAEKEDPNHQAKMQAAFCNVAPPSAAFSRSAPRPTSTPVAVASRAPASVVKAAASRSFQTVNYNSPISVFPAEACETVGGEACLADIYPELRVEPKPARINVAVRPDESIERDYLDYRTAKTVFPAEACDDLGGEFCEKLYQRGVY
ncbi:hypothetical protein SAY87_024787 [Trapa incisa]|uniref:Light-regulated protein n=1 Tax=Trapa incisa TaxID=236973 RepID=A0AAN7GGH0_9MYRT|nr:hypothetical protein SAY87_024787 [Trapa incisa]